MIIPKFPVGDDGTGSNIENARQSVQFTDRADAELPDGQLIRAVSWLPEGRLGENIVPLGYESVGEVPTDRMTFLAKGDGRGDQLRPLDAPAEPLVQRHVSSHLPGHCYRHASCWGKRGMRMEGSDTFQGIIRPTSCLLAT